MGVHPLGIAAPQIQETEPEKEILKKKVHYGTALINEIKSLSSNAEFEFNKNLYEKMQKVQTNVKQFRENLEYMRKNHLTLRDSDSLFSASFNNRNWSGSLKEKLQVIQSFISKYV